jgi:hypothetical protein
VKRAVLVEVEKCRPKFCPYCEAVGYNSPIAFVCVYPKSPLGRLLEISEIVVYEKIHGKDSFPYSIPEQCGLEPYDLFYAAIKATKESADECH